MFECFFKASKSMVDLVSQTDVSLPDEVKRTNLFLEWTECKSKYFSVEKQPLSIPDSVFPHKVTQFAYNKNPPQIKLLIDKYYSAGSQGTDYTLNSPVAIENQDKLPMLNNLVFIRGNVVWVDFGFNIGCEFGGKHPAIVLKNLGDALIVAPLTSGVLTNPKISEVPITIVYNLPARDRYTNVTRITPISVYRIDLDSPVGSIKSSDMKAIFNAMKLEWHF